MRPPLAWLFAAAASVGTAPKKYYDASEYPGISGNDSYVAKRLAAINQRLNISMEDNPLSGSLRGPYFNMTIYVEVEERPAAVVGENCATSQIVNNIGYTQWKECYMICWGGCANLWYGEATDPVEKIYANCSLLLVCPRHEIDSTFIQWISDAFVDLLVHEIAICYPADHSYPPLLCPCVVIDLPENGDHYPGLLLGLTVFALALATGGIVLLFVVLRRAALNDTSPEENEPAFVG